MVGAVLFAIGLSALAAGGQSLSERELRSALQKHPDDAHALGLLGVVLDGQKRYEEAERCYNRAVRLAPSAPLLNNLGNHHVATGKLKNARDVFLRVIAIEPHHANANLQLARMSAANKNGDEVLNYLNRLPSAEQAAPGARLLRAQGLHWTGKASMAADLLKEVELGSKSDPRLAFSIGMIWVEWGKFDRAEQAFARALEPGPANFEVLYNLGLAAARAGHLDHAQSVFENALQQRPEDLDALYNLARVHTARGQENVVLDVRLAKVLLTHRKISEALAVFRRVPALTADRKVLADCGRTLLRYEQYAAARDFLQPDAAVSSDARLDLAIAVFHSVSPEAGMAELEQIPERERNGDYYLLRAEILDSLGKTEEAANSLNQGFRASPSRPDLYRQAALFLIKHNRASEAVDMLQKAASTVADASELLLVQAIALELRQRSEEAEKVLARIQSRWPEWDRSYLIHGIILQMHGRPAEGRQMLETAINLGADVPEAYYYLALAITHQNPEDPESAQKAIARAIELDAADPYIRALAGKIALARKEYRAAVEHLSAAIRLQPELVQAHYALSACYRALGEKSKAAAELAEIQAIRLRNPQADQELSPMRALLFSVRPTS